MPLLALILWGCQAGRHRPHTEQAEIMGTTFSITIEGFADASRAAQAAFEEIRRIDRLLSTYKKDSEISNVNLRAAKETVVVGSDFWLVAAASREYFNLSDGCFDPTVFPLMKAWGFRKKEGILPPAEELIKIMPLVDFAKVMLDDTSHTVSFREEGMSLDFGGIAKGYAVDRAIAALRDLGVTRAIVDAGGNFYGLGTPQARERWQTGIRHPFRLNEIIARFPVSDAGVATSGNYERFFEIDGKKYCHIMDPRTGWPVPEMLSATVIANTAMAADALSTSVFVLGKEKGMDLIENLPGIEGMLIVQDADLPEGFRIILSSGLRNKIEILLPAAS